MTSTPALPGHTTATEPESAVTAPRWIPIFIVCFAVWTLSNLDQSIFGYAIPGILAEFNQPIQTAGLVLAISFVASSVFVVGSGLASDRFGRGATLSVLLALSALSVGLQGFAQSIVGLTILRSLAFGFGGGLSPITSAFVVEAVPARLRGMAIGVLQCGYPLGWFLASLLASPLLRSGGWRAACFAGFVVVPLALPIFWLLRRASPDRRTANRVTVTSEKRARIADVFDAQHRRISISCIITFFCFAGAYAGSAFFFTTYFTSVRHYTPEAAVSLVGSSNGIAILGYLAASLIGEFLLPRRTVFVIWMVCGAGSLLGLLWLSRTPFQDVIWYATMAGFFYGAASVFPVIIAELFPTRIRSTALAVCGSMPQCLGFAVFPLLVPQVVAHFGWTIALTAMVVPPMLIAAVSILAVPERRSGLSLSDTQPESMPPAGSPS